MSDQVEGKVPLRVISCTFYLLWLLLLVAFFNIRDMLKRSVGRWAS